MRLAEFTSSSDKFILLIKNFIGRAQSKKQPAKLNWQTLNSMLKSAGEETMDYESFKAMYDANPTLQPMISNFNADGIELKVPGVADEPEASQDAEQSQDDINQQAASVAQSQISS